MDCEQLGLRRWTTLSQFAKGNLVEGGGRRQGKTGHFPFLIFDLISWCFCVSSWIVCLPDNSERSTKSHERARNDQKMTDEILENEKWKMPGLSLPLPSASFEPVLHTV